jgi:methylthioribose-1-phosphate isomerase
MKVDSTPYRSIWVDENGGSVDIIDQTRLPHEFIIITLRSLQDAAEAIGAMRVRGAPLIGATAAYGFALALREDASDGQLKHAYETLLATRPTAVNLRWALHRMKKVLAILPVDQRQDMAYAIAAEICDEDVGLNHAIGQHGLGVVRQAWENKPPGAEALHILTHCNAGWLATVDWGTALSVIYQAYD